MKKQFQLFAWVLLSTTAFLSGHCARKCPSDINISDLNLSPYSKSFMPANQQVSTMVFTNTAGEKLTFKRQNDSDWDKRAALAVETLCERGEFLDKTVQTAYFNAETYHSYYTTADEQYTLAVDIQFNNNGMYGDRKDTIFYETFASWGQRLKMPTRTGSVQVMTAERGNSDYIRENIRENSNQYKLVGDTTLLQKNIKNAWVSDPNDNHTLFIFYTLANGIEAFTTDTEIWVRTQ